MSEPSIGTPEKCFQNVNLICYEAFAGDGGFKWGYALPYWITIAQGIGEQ